MKRSIIIALPLLLIGCLAIGQTALKSKPYGINIDQRVITHFDSLKMKSKSIPQTKEQFIKKEEISFDLSESDDLMNLIGGLDLDACHSIRLSGWMYIEELFRLKSLFPKLKKLDMGELKLITRMTIDTSSIVPIIGQEVHSLPYNFFEGHQYIETVILPDTISRIEAFA